MTRATERWTEQANERRRIRRLQSECRHELVTLVPETQKEMCCNCGLVRDDFRRLDT